jgi:hypothetical protein
MKTTIEIIDPTVMPMTRMNVSLTDAINIYARKLQEIIRLVDDGKMVYFDLSDPPFSAKLLFRDENGYHLADYSEDIKELKKTRIHAEDLLGLLFGLLPVMGMYGTIDRKSSIYYPEGDE